MTLLLTLIITPIVLILGFILLCIIYGFSLKKFGSKIAGAVIIIIFLLPIVYKVATSNSSLDIDTRIWADKPRSEWTNKDMQDYIDWNIQEGHKEWENKKISE